MSDFTAGLLVGSWVGGITMAAAFVVFARLIAAEYHRRSVEGRRSEAVTDSQEKVNHLLSQIAAEPKKSTGTMWD